MLSLSQTGLQFQAVAGVGGAMQQAISVLNARPGAMPFQANASTLNLGNWLSVSTAAGTASDSAPAVVNVQVNPQGLAPGFYSGRVDFSVPGAVKSPQAVTVSLTVLPPTPGAGAAVSTTGLIFVAKQGSNPAPQNVQVTNPANQTLTISATAVFSQAQGWFTSTVSGNSESVAVNTAGLGPGIYRGVLNVKVAETNSTFPVAILLVVTPPTAACMPTRLAAVVTRGGDGFQGMAGVPLPLQVSVIDDCGTPLAAGSVIAVFSTRDTPVDLNPLGNGIWSGTWLPHGAAGGAASAAITATSSAPALRGSLLVSGNFAPDKTTPLVNLLGVVSGASFVATPLAPGGFISIFGTNLAAAPILASALPLPTMLGGTQVLLGGQPLPLQYVSAAQINAIVPYTIPANSIEQLLVEQNGAYSLAETLLVSRAQPAMFTADASGVGTGAFGVVKPDGTQLVASAATPASAGDALVIYCTGLGAVNPAVVAGSAAPTDQPATTVNTVTVTIGGNAAQVLFSGLAPGFAGLNQVNVRVPQGIVPGPSVPVVLTAGGAISTAVTIAIQ
jgi:uncharacterized protein (TIGR03437 family)